MSKIKVTAGLVSSEPSFLSCIWPSSLTAYLPGHSLVCVCLYSNFLFLKGH